MMAKRAKYERIERSRAYFGSIRGVQGVWAKAGNRKACEKELREVLAEWDLLKMRRLNTFPTV